ncbi:MAG: pimeloyl-ACP methyl ester carboxylesterase [Acidimicrobiales bacterium]|jgi:pimeloyl-ACP methyl ester carboxylesterase
MSLENRRITTRRGIEGDVLVGGSGPDLVFFHGAGGTTAEDPLLNQLAKTHTVHAPLWPGYGPDETETLIEDMLDFTLHGWDLVDALELKAPPILMGHSMGGMIASEMAAVARTDLSKLVLLCPAGIWDDAHPVPDIFAMLPFELAEVLFHDPVVGEKIMTGGVDFSDNEALANFMVGNARRLGTAGKILFPIPNRRLSKRIHRIGVPTLLVWGENDKLFALEPYGAHWASAIADTQLVTVGEAGHMLHVEQTADVAAAITSFL